MFPVHIANNIVNITSSIEDVTHTEVTETLEHLANNASSYQSKNLIIIDPGSNYNPSQSELHKLISLINLLLDEVFHRVALVVSKTSHYGIGRMIEGYSSGAKGQFSVFNNEQEARDWMTG